MIEDLISEYGIVLASIVCIVIGALVFMNKKAPTVLPTTEFQLFPLIRKEKVSHDVAIFTFGLPEGHVLGLPTGQHVSLRFKDSEGKSHQRSYTPITDNSSVGEFSLCVKIYKANVHPKFPEGGKMSQHLDSLKIGDKMEIKGPKGHMEYLTGGKFTVKPLGKPLEHRQTNQIIMLAGGTGITPMLQILHFIFKNPGVPNIKVNLLYANQTDDDILVRAELEALQRDFKGRFNVHYTLDRPPANWEYSTGFITKEMIAKKCLFGDSSANTQVFMCGPPPMIKFACKPNLEELGFTAKEMVIF
ncbi:unnamed protein product [Cylindrotheca closterium]|uniref:FAD-binding FR-type domain-containing protein n=1 Tax=Cylindrotheca closterium TaxID=2856 RepID=A0AAD2CH62_9STRA|nr:unnamed protein product [Cylindrotheca closterium]